MMLHLAYCGTQLGISKEYIMLDVRRNIDNYLSDNSSIGRYSSFDYCYNYFQSFYERNEIADIAKQENREMSCLQLAFYLASWGMLRGSSFLLQRSMKYYEPVIEVIAHMGADTWNIDVDAYSDKNIDMLLACEEEIAQAIGQGRNVSIILTTKIMLGVFGNIPAFDTYFRSGFGIHTLSRKSLHRIAQFYQDHKYIIDEYHIPTIDFATGQNSHRYYPKAKLIDMIGFIAGGTN